MSSSAAYAREIRDYLLARLEKLHDDDAIQRSADELPSRWLFWWIFEGKRYAGYDEPLARSWPSVARQLVRLRAVHSPSSRVVPSPEGEVDWLGSGLVSLTSGRRQYVARASGIGLSDDERAALDGWTSWIAAKWAEYVKDVGPSAGVSEALPDQFATAASFASAASLRRWAHVARRSRWPLLRNVVAESLRSAMEPEEIDRLPLPTVHDKLFELVCIVRALKTMHPPTRRVRWLDLHDGGNSLALPGLACRYQLHRSNEQVRAAFAPDMQEALIRHGVSVAGYVDVWFQFDPPRNGFVGMLVECKSGAQVPAAAVGQMFWYREGLRKDFPGRVLVLGVVEDGRHALDDALETLGTSAAASGDVCAFCSVDELPAVLRAAGVQHHAQS